MTDKHNKTNSQTQDELVQDELDSGFAGPIISSIPTKLHLRQILAQKQKETLEVLSKKSAKENEQANIKNHINQFEVERKNAGNWNAKVAYDYLERISYFLKTGKITFEQLSAAQSDGKKIDQDFLDNMKTFAANQLASQKFLKLKRIMGVDFDENGLGVQPDFIFRLARKKGFEVEVLENGETKILSPKKDFEEIDQYLDSQNLVRVSKNTILSSIDIKDLLNILENMVDVDRFVLSHPSIQYFENEQNPYIGENRKTHLQTTSMTKIMLQEFQNLVLELTFLYIEKNISSLKNSKFEVQKIQNLIHVIDYLFRNQKLLGLSPDQVEKMNSQNIILNEKLAKLQNFG